MSDTEFGSAKPMPVTGSGCGIRPSREAMDVDFTVDFSEAKKLLKENATDNGKSSPSKQINNEAQ